MDFHDLAPHVEMIYEWMKASPPMTITQFRASVKKKGIEVCRATVRLNLVVSRVFCNLPWSSSPSQPSAQDDEANNHVKRWCWDAILMCKVLVDPKDIVDLLG